MGYKGYIKCGRSELYYNVSGIKHLQAKKNLEVNLSALATLTSDKIGKYSQ